MFGDYVVADFVVNMSTGDLDWSEVNVQTLPLTSMSLVVNLTQLSAPGISATHSLYVYRYSNQTEVNVCPEAVTIADVSESCTNRALLVEGENGTNAYPLEAVTVSGKNYWKIDGLTGTGAFSSLFETGFTLRDLMTRQQIDTASNHEIRFGTTYDLTRLNNSITLDFGEWGSFGTLDVADIVLRSVSTVPATVVHTLDITAGVDVWGVEIDDGTKEIIFTAPTNSDSDESITLGSTITVFINAEKMVNPSVAGSYPISMFLISYDGEGGSGTNSESGEVNVPIVDSDTVDVTGYISAFMHFDIDTGITEVPGDITVVDCNYTSPSACLTHENGEAGTNYTVDLGELTFIVVNKSNGLSPIHADGEEGVINSIYFDLTTNSPSGAVVTVRSLNGGLQGPDTNKILAVTDGEDILANDGTFGFNLPVASDVSSGTVVKNTSCSSVLLDTYCGAETTPKTVFSTNSLPIDAARVRMDLAAAAAYTNSPGNYTDTLTFVATATF
jgi:hypothetical protein